MVLLGMANVTFPQENLKIISYNIWNGFNWGKNIKKHNSFIEWVKKNNPDILAMQELCGYTLEKLKNDAKKWGHNYVAIAKEGGYPVGITSKFKINVKEKILKDMHHGALHCSIKGIDFIVVHLSPFDYQKRLSEVKNLETRINTDSDFVLLGDFNALSPLDSLVYKKTKLVETFLQVNNNRNLVNGKIDYSVISKVMLLPLFDSCADSWDCEEGGSCPSIASFEGKIKTKDEIIDVQRRIDYIFLSKSLIQFKKQSRIIHSDFTNYLSDHYPVELILNLNIK
jgi:exodeoxyribonuclease-3